MDKIKDYDLLILGAGPGGYVSAIRAAQLGLKTVLIEKDQVGGVCLNLGCIPSKSLIHQAQIFSNIKNLEALGIKVDKENFNYEKVIIKTKRVIERLRKGINYLLKKNKVELIKDEGKLINEHEVALSSGKVIKAKNIIIATGSKPKDLPSFPFDGKDILSSNDIFSMKELPKKIMILGAGAIGVEISYIMNSFGVEVYLVEALDQILPLEDEEISAILSKSFEKRKIKVYTSTRALSFEKEDMLEVTLERKDSIKMVVETEKILVAVGRIPNTLNIGLENVGIELDQGGFIPVNDYYQTQIPNIYAIGDVINTPLLAHVASREGEIAVEHIAGKNPPPRIESLEIPSTIYCEPQIASFGYNETLLKNNKIPYEKVIFPYKGCGKAVAIDKSEGMIKVLYEPETKEILGAHIIGADATELIHEILLAKKSELLPTDIATMIHAHPTLSEIVMEVMRAIEGYAIHF